MAFTINVNNKPLEIKFNYRLLYKANKTLGTVNTETGKRNEDGAGNLFVQVIQKNDDAIIDIIKLVYKGKLSDEEIFSAIEDYLEKCGADSEKEAYNTLFNEMKEEMLASGFFVSKLEMYLENMDKAAEMMKGKKDSESKAQLKAIQDLRNTIAKESSLPLAQDSE